MLDRKEDPSLQEVHDQAPAEIAQGAPALLEVGKAQMTRVQVEIGEKKFIPSLSPLIL